MKAKKILKAWKKSKSPAKAKSALCDSAGAWREKPTPKEGGKE